MKYLFVGAILILHSFTVDSLAQPLQQQLRQEQPNVLAAEALRSGNAARGAILFASAELACVSCHASGETDRLGPDLSNLARDTSDTDLVESLLSPSEKIRTGFEQQSILTSAGIAHTGRVVQEDKQQITLRPANDPTKRLTILRADIELQQQLRKSAMPDNLIDQLANRSQFLDLLRYVIQLRDQATVEQPGKDKVQISEAVRGQVLIEQNQCNVCHETLRRETELPIRQGPDLTWAAGRISPEFVEEFILDPATAHPGTTMPNMLSSIPDDKKHETARALTHFVQSLGAEPFQAQSLKQAAIDRGRELFNTVGCLACHPQQLNDSTSIEIADSINLSHVGRKYNLDGLTDLLENPHAVRPLSGMPNMQLTHWEAVDIASFLLRSASAQATRFALDETLIEKGRTHFAQLGCASCHQLPKDAVHNPTRFRLTDDLVFDRKQGCLSKTSFNGSPIYTLDETAISDIKIASRATARLQPDEQIQLTLARFNCTACHDRNGIGGVNPDRNEHFHTANPNIGPQGRLPPTLTGVGSKLNRKWLRQVLVSGKSIRPYMKTRMPQFGASNVSHLVDLFVAQDSQSELAHPRITDDKAARTTGHDLVSRDGLNCIACHTYQLKPAPTMPAIDLTDMTERLQKDWFVRYLKDPQTLSPRTVMPSFWPGGKSVRQDILNGDVDAQIAAIWHYLSDGRQARQPKGLNRERIELLASDEAVMLRRSWPNVGKRGIGVGYPLQVNQLFDAEQMRVAAIWRGRFADPSGVWRSQGHGVARPLERQQFQFTAGPDLDSATSPWQMDGGRPPEHQFKGYDLDERQRPTFRYRFRTIEVTDTMKDTVDATNNELTLTRTVTFDSKDRHDNLTLRIASGKTLTRQQDGNFLLSPSLRIHVLSDQTPVFSKADATNELRVAVDIPKGKTKVIVEYRWPTATSTTNRKSTK